MKRITEVEILGEPHSVEYSPLRKAHGTYIYGKIKLDSAGSKRKQIRTLVHEYAHGIFEDSHDPDSTVGEEDFARLFEQGVVDLVRNNWAVIERLKGEVG